MAVATLPYVQPLPASFSLVEAFRRLRSQPGCLWLDSAARGPDEVGRYSFLTADPLDTFRADRDAANPWPRLAEWIAGATSGLVRDSQLPPFQGGVAGLFGYEAGAWLEPVGCAAWDDLPTPPFSLGWYDWTIAADHQTGQYWLISQGTHRAGGSETERASRAAGRARQVIQWLGQSVNAPQMPGSRTFAQRAQLAPQHATERHAELTSNFSPAAYRDAVAAIVHGIGEGDSFQVNLSQRLLFPQRQPASELFLRLRETNAAPFAAYFDGGDFQVLSSSPEGFLRVRERLVETRPIKGTVPRTGDAATDRRLAEQLVRSEKDRAENVMIVDLMRNDLSRICTDDSVHVAALCAIESYAFVQHLVSVVTGRLRDEVSLIDLLTACFPGGSVTGAPKVEAMRTISRIEPTARGPYCGSIGYLCGDGTADLNILIRTITAAHGWLQIPVGGGITAASDPAAEERETWHKAEGMLRAVLP